MIKLFLTFLLANAAITAITGTRIVAGNFKRNGKNVCERKLQETETYKEASVTHFPVSRKTKCGLFGWFRCKQQSTATRTIYHIRTKLVDVIVLHCCDGWKEGKTGSGVCDEAYCNKQCQNGGTCIGGKHKCHCPKQWTGDLCQTDVDECRVNNGNCEQVCTNYPGSYVCGCTRGYTQDIRDKSRCQDVNECNFAPCECANQQSMACGAKCTNILGGYKCSCAKGYKLVGPSVCQDIDECLSAQTNNCPSKCVNTPGSYQCNCTRGFKLADDGTTCVDINECAINNGGCQHTCLNAYGTYVCQCRIGFKLHRNRMRCEDVDECQLFHGCEKKCNNNFGSYYCSCPKGYALNADRFTCSDINECSFRKVKGLSGNTSLSDCEQHCINTVGSFKCSCKRGFLLRSDGKSCRDADECVTGTHKCNHKCHNTIGSYVCSCRPGYTLGPDKKTCKPLSCESIERPFHGTMTCTGFSTGAECLFECDPGYQRFGSKKRTCLPSSKWNDTTTTCRAKKCPELLAPENAAVLLPCHKTFRSTCSLQCMEGYFSKDSGIAKCDVDASGKVAWSGKQLKCEKIQVCDPNPCLNNGKCTIQGNSYVCNCDKTGYEGPVCQTGILKTPDFEKLKVNQESQPLYLRAKPRNELRVTIKSTQAIVVKPKRDLIISKSSQKVQFTIIPLRAGFHVLSYVLGGEDAKNFKVPNNNTVYAEIKGKMESVYNQLQIEKGTLPFGCHDYNLPDKLLQCQGNLTSTHHWSPALNMKRVSQGIVHIKTKTSTVPVSLFGTNAMATPPTRKELLDKIRKISSQSMNSSISIRKNDKCEIYPLKGTDLLEFIQTDAFPRSFLLSFSKLMPNWIRFNIDKNNNLFDISNLIVSIGRPPSHGPGECEEIPLPFAGKVFFKPAIAYQAYVDGETKAFGANEKACFAIDMCKNKAFIAFSSEARNKFLQLKILRDMKSNGWNFQVSSLGIRKQVTEDGNDNNFNMWIKGKTEVDISDSRLSIKGNISGDISIKSKHFQEIFTDQFTTPMSGEVKGKISIKTTMQLQNSGTTTLKFNSDKSSGQFTFGGDGESLNRLPVKCETSQGAHITFKSKENPFQRSVLSSSILPYLQSSMNLSIYHKIEGGGQTGVRIPADLQMKFMILGFVVGQLKSTLQGVVPVVPQLKSEGMNVFKMANQLEKLVSETSATINANLHSTLSGEKANKLKNSITSLNSQIASVSASSTKLSKKLLQYKANNQVPVLIAGIRNFHDNIKTIKSLKLDVVRSPLKQDLKGLIIGTMAQLCLGQLCIPDVKTSLVSVDDDIKNSPILTCLPEKSLHDITKEQFPLVIASPSKEMKLGKIFYVQKDHKIILGLSHQLLQMNSIINVFGISKQIVLNVSNKQLNTFVRGNIFKKFQSNINITADTTDVDGWEALVYKLRGQMDKDSTLTRMLEKSLNSYAMELVERSEKRLEKAKLGLKNATMRVQNARKALNLSGIALKSLEKNNTVLQKLLKRKKYWYSLAIAWFDDALNQYNKTSYSTKSCTLAHCKRICKKTCIRDVCQDKANISYTKSDCSYVDSAISKLMPAIDSKIMTYTTTPQIRKYVGKCKNWLTAFGESFLTFGLFGKRRKRSLATGDDQKLSTGLNVNEHLKSSNLSLKRDFDINIELRKRVPQLPKNFDINKALESYIKKQHGFDINIILKEQFPALSSTFDINKELVTAVPELRKKYNFNAILKKTVLKAVRSKTPISFTKELGSISPELQTNLDSVLKRSLPQLRTLDNIPRIIQIYLDEVVKFSTNAEKLQKFNVTSLIKTKFRGLGDVNINTLLQQKIPQLGSKFSINKLIINAALGIGPTAGKLDEMIAKASGIREFNLQNMLSKVFPGFEHHLNFDEFIKNELKDMMTVYVNETMLKTLTFSNIIKHKLPNFKDVDVDEILISAFPRLVNKLNIREILLGAVPLMKVLEDVNLNQVLMGVFKSTESLDLDKLLKTRNPALRGQINIERYLSKRLKDVVLPNFDRIVKKTISEFSNISVNIDGILENIIGKDGIEDLRNLVYTSVFSSSPQNAVFGDGASHRKRNRVRRDLLGFGINLLTGNILGSAINAFRNSGCTHVYDTTLGNPETHQYEFKRAVIKAENIPVKMLDCKKPRMVNITSKGYGRPRACCRTDIPCVEFLDPVCVKKNENCFKERKEGFKRYQSLFNVSLFEQYKKLVSSEKDVADVTLQIEEVRLRKEVAVQNFEIVKARVNQLLAMENTSRIIYQKVKSIPQVDLGLKVKNILKDSFDKQPLRISELSFHTVSSSLAKPRLPFIATIRTRNKDFPLNFIVDFENVNSSVSYATEKAISHLISPSRKRRSINTVSSSITASNQNYDSCSLARNASLYFSDILTSLRQMLASYGEQRSRIHEEMNVLDDLQKNLKSSKSQENSITEKYSKVLSVYKKDRNDQSDMMPWNESFALWKNYVENMTEIRQLPSCSGALDCIEQLSELLSKEYKGLGKSDETTKILNMLVDLIFGINNLLVDDELKEDQVKSKLQNLFLMLNKTQDKNLLCIGKPKMLTNSNKEVRVLAGEKVTLHCRASSETEIFYTWKRNNDLLQTSQDGTLELRNLQETNQGLYRCEARNHKGGTFSGITTIKVESRPQILEHPDSSRVPVDRKSIVKFSCVASGKPTPTITWLYRPPSSNISMVIPDESSNLLSIVPDDKMKSGYYYCEARNARGLAVSREARLDILTITAASPIMLIAFNVTTSCEAKPCQGEQAVPPQMDTTLKQNIQVMITKSLGLLSRRISRLRYRLISKSLAQISLFVSTPLANQSKDLSTSQIMEKFSEARVNLAGKLKRLIRYMNRTTLPTKNSSSSLVGLVKTLGFLHVQPVCPPGQWLHKNGYFCVKCPPGSYKKDIQGTCIRCAIGAYQPRSGQAGCISCGPRQTTRRGGTIDATSCIMKAVCPPGSFKKEEKCLVCPPKTYQPLAGKNSCIPCNTGPELKEGQTTCKRQGPGKPYPLMVFTLSSTSIKVLWWKPKTGSVSHYELEYGYPGKKAFSPIKIYPMTQSYHSGMQYVIGGLEKYTEYILKVYAVFENQRGQPATYTFRTKGDVPDASPKITSALAVSSTAIEVKWQELPVHARNGFITKYTVYFKENAYALFYRKRVRGKHLSTVLTRLKQNTRYCIKMTASTREGTYPNWKDNPCYWAKTMKVIM